MSELEHRLARAGRILDDASAVRAESLVAAPPPAPPRRHLTLAAAAVVIVAIGIGALVLQAQRRPADNPDVPAATTTSSAPSTTTAPPPATGSITTGVTAPSVTTTSVTTPSTTVARTPATTDAPTTATATSVGGPTVHPAGVQSARPRDNRGAAAGDRADVGAWTPVGTFPDDPELTLVATWFQPTGLCLAVRRDGATGPVHSACPVTSTGYGVVALDDGRLAVLGAGPLDLATTQGTAVVGTFTVDAPDGAGGTEAVPVAAAVLDAGVDLVGVGGARNDDCPYGVLLAAFAARETDPRSFPRTLTSARCTSTAAVVGSWASAYVDQPDTVVLDRPAGGAWTWQSEGGAPCDLDENDPAQRRAVAACRTLGLLRGP